jgi:hypothetical protein
VVSKGKKILTKEFHDFNKDYEDFVKTVTSIPEGSRPLLRNSTDG